MRCEICATMAGNPSKHVRFRYTDSARIACGHRVVTAERKLRQQAVINSPDAREAGFLRRLLLCWGTP